MSNNWAGDSVVVPVCFIIIILMLLCFFSVELIRFIVTLTFSVGFNLRRLKSEQCIN